MSNWLLPASRRAVLTLYQHYSSKIVVLEYHPEYERLWLAREWLCGAMTLWSPMNFLGDAVQMDNAKLLKSCYLLALSQNWLLNLVDGVPV